MCKKFGNKKNVSYVWCMEEKEKKLLKVTKFAALADMAPTTVYTLIREGKLDFVEKPRGSQKIKLVPESELKKFEK